MQLKVFTIFPEIIEDFCNASLLGKALAKNLWHLEVINIRDYATDPHRKVDDDPYAGGHGMVMKPDVIAKALEDKCDVPKTDFYYMTPRGNMLTQERIKTIVENDSTNHHTIAILCGRYEGVDQRVIDYYKMQEISIGDFVLMGGELPTLVLIEALVRCLPSVVGDEKSIEEDSFGGLGGSTGDIYKNLLEYPLYTKPRVWNGLEVPEVLISGHHKNIEEWKLQQAKEITRQRRPDLFKKYLENYE